jgi:hypothetical protein
MRELAYVACALAGLIAAPGVTVSAARADDVRQDHRDIRQDERAIDHDQARAQHDLRDGNVGGAAHAEQQEQRAKQDLAHDPHDLSRDRAIEHDR